MSFVARDESMWQGFPGMCLTPSGRLVVAVKQAYGHGASRWSRGIVTTSDDRGRTWSKPKTFVEGDFDKEQAFAATGGFYLTTLRSGRILLHYFNEAWPERAPATPFVRISDDEGDSWAEPRRMTDDLHFRPDGAILELRDGTLLLYSNMNRILRSTDNGETWEPFGGPVVPEDCPLQLGEVCLSEVIGGAIIMLARENHYANFPMFALRSEDKGASWSRPEPSPFVGHWPATYDLGDGTHVLAYRNIGGRANSLVWRGDLSTAGGYRPSSCRYDDGCARMTDDGLLVDTTGPGLQFSQYFLLPHDDSDSTVALEAEVRCLANAGHACAVGLRGVGWLRIFPDHVDFEHIPRHSEIPVTGNDWHTYRLDLHRRALRVSIDGEQVLSYPAIDFAPVTHTPCTAFGTKFDYRQLPRPELYPMRVRLPNYVLPSNEGKSMWRRVSLTVSDQRWMPDYRYEWRADRDGMPDRFQEEAFLELERCQDTGDWGKPVPVVFGDGECFAIDYFGNGMPVGYPSVSFLQPDRGHNCYVRGYRFSLEDLPASSG
jgi:hypothetical protein